jgi:hypothetical protein
MRILSHTLSASLLSILVLSGCAKDASDDEVIDTGTPVIEDLDNDGYTTEEGDCNDTDSTVFPGASDIAGDAIDQDCDGIDGVDSDGDGFASTISGGDDCDDSDSEVYPTAIDSVGDSVDQDCDGVDGVDADGDGWASVASGGTDCNDNQTDFFPGAPDSFGDGADQNCDGIDGVDADNDGWASSAGGGEDCDDSDADAYPGAVEYCDGHDDNCDGEVDEDTSSDSTIWYQDADTDGFGDALAADVACYQPMGYVLDSTDCDDTDANAYPGATEYCDGHDDDCDGDTDEDESVDVSTWYADADADGYGDAASTDIDCYQPTGYVADATDCDDTESTTYPGADEYCDGHDDNCDGDIDEDASVDVNTWYADSDSDGEGDAAVTDIDCYQPTGYVDNSTDCDDSSSTLNTADSDGDGFTSCGTDCDDADSTAYVGAASLEPSLCTHDIDGDGYGDEFAASPLDAGTDCDDADSTAYVGAASLEPSLCTHDIDGDGYGDEFAASPLDAGTDCDDSDASLESADADADGYSTCDGDCDDSDATLESADGDGDGYSTCDGDCDDNDASVESADADADGYSTCDGDCDDSDSFVLPADCSYEVYIEYAELVNLTDSCSSGHEYNDCGGGDIGFTWTDSNGGSPASIVVEVNRGINCLSSDKTAATDLNSISSGSFTWTASNCSCTPYPEVLTWTLTNVSGFNPLGSNTFMIESVDTSGCDGLSQNSSWTNSAYARVTVSY